MPDSDIALRIVSADLCERRMRTDLPEPRRLDDLVRIIELCHGHVACVWRCRYKLGQCPVGVCYVRGNG